MADSLDPSFYVRPPRVGVATGLSLGKMLLTVVPKKGGPGVVRGAKLLQTSVRTLEDAWKAQSQPRRILDARPFDHRIDRVWSVLSNRLQHFEIFPSEHRDRVRAVEIQGALFPSGLDFIVLPYLAQHAESARRVDGIVGDAKFRADLERLTGEMFVVELIQAHDAYGDALGITTASPATPESVSLVEPLRQLSKAISAYALQVLAFGDGNPAVAAAAARALEPIDKFRRAAARRSGTSAPEVTAGEEPIDVEIPADAPAPDAPIPDVPEVENG